MNIAFCNGKFIESDEPCIPLTDRGFLFGDAIFTTVKIIDGTPEFIEDHFNRLKSQCETLRIDPPELILSDILQLIIKTKAEQGIWRLKIIITGGSGLSLNLQKRKFGMFLMTIAKAELNVSNPARVCLFPTPIAKPSAKLKNLSYLDRLYVMVYALSQGVDDAIVLSREGFILETAFSNIFWVIGMSVFVPDPDLDLMMGITLIRHLEVLRESGHVIHHVREKLENIPSAAEFFICNSIKGIVPVFIVS